VITLEEIRKIQLTGGTTYTVSLPKKWVRQYNLKPGDPVYIRITKDGDILISAKKMEREEKIAEIIVNKNISSERLARDVVAYYLAGYDKIIIKFKCDMQKHRLFLKKFVKNKMIGLELIEEGRNYVLLQSIIKGSEFPVRKAIERMSIVVSFMMEDAINALLSGSKELAQRIIETDDDVDRLYLYLVRQLNEIVGNPYLIGEVGLKSNRECLSYRLISKSIERIGDHTLRIANVVLFNNISVPEDMKEKLKSLADELRNYFEKSVEAALNRNSELAHDLLDELPHYKEIQEELIKQLLKLGDIKVAMGLRIVIDSLRRIADYSADIAEIAINLATPEA